MPLHNLPLMLLMKKQASNFAVLIFLTAILPPAAAQQDSTTYTQFNKKKCILATTAIVAASSVSYIALDELWYNNYERTSLHSFNDNTEWLQMDKVGHFMTSYQLGIAGYETFRWCGMDEKHSTWLGGSLGTIYLTGLEILDGRSKAWGFSWGDETANFSGSLFFIGQQLLWNEQRVKMKFSFTPSSLSHCRPEVLGETFSQQILKDYNGQTYWMSGNISSFMSSENNFPKWLNMAIGYGADGMTTAHDYAESIGTCGDQDITRTRQFFLSPDIDLTRINTRSKFLKSFFRVISFVKLPFPVVEYSVDKGWFVHSFYF